MKLIFHVITHNEEGVARRWCDSWLPAMDGLCLVRSVGSCEPDKTLDIITEECAKRSLPFAHEELVNPPGTEDWPHTASFADARNKALDLATIKAKEWFGDEPVMVLWVDLDDILAPGGIEKLRASAEGSDWIEAQYDLLSHGRRFYRERGWLPGMARWERDVHERLVVIKQPKNPKRSEAVWVHLPLGATRSRSRERNLRIYERSLAIHQKLFERERDTLFDIRYYQAQDLEFEGRNTEAVEAMKHVCSPDNPNQSRRYDALLWFLRRAETVEGVRQLAGDAVALAPHRKEAYGIAAERLMEIGQPVLSRGWIQTCAALPQPQDQSPGHMRDWNTWKPAYMAARIEQACGNFSAADALRKRLIKAVDEQHNGTPIISVLHATRRMKLAATVERSFRDVAFLSAGVEWIYGLDADDQEGIDTAKRLGLPYVLVEEGAGPVAAWNAVAEEATGQILMTMSDDWLPCLQWDNAIRQRLAKAVSEGKQAVLAVDDCIRKDRLMCIQILTRERYKAQGNVLDPRYWSVYSDDDFTWKAYRDGVVIEAFDIRIPHNNPVLKGEEMDEVSQRSNDRKNYLEGSETFRKLHPDAAAFRFAPSGSGCWVSDALGLAKRT